MSSITDDTIIQAAIDETYGPGETMASVVCQANGAKDVGQIAAYQMIRKLIEGGVPVHWALRDSKTAWADYDIAIAAGVGGAVQHMNYLGTKSNLYAGVGTMKYAGAPYLIAADDVPLAMTVLAANSGVTDMDKIDYHVTEESFDAPIFKTMRSIPKFAVLDFTGIFDGGDLGKMTATLDDVGLVAGSDYDILSVADINGGLLIPANYTLAFMVSYIGTDPAAASTAEATLAAIEAYAAAGGSVVAQEDAVPSLEGEGSYNSTNGQFTTSSSPAMSSAWTHSINGIEYSIFSSIYGGNTGGETTASDDYSDPASQWGGANWESSGGAKSNWFMNCEQGYRDGVRRQVFTSGQSVGSDGVDFASWKYYNNDPSLGRIYYLGGKNWSKNSHTGFRLLLNTIFVTAADTAAASAREVSRSSPIISAINGEEFQFYGTLEIETPLIPGAQYGGKADDNTFEFPNVKGHFRATKTSKLFNGIALDITAPGVAEFDVASKLASMSTNTNGGGCAWPADGLCRRIFTNDNNNMVMLTKANLGTFAAEFGDAADGNAFKNAEVTVLTERVHAGFDIGGGNYEPALGGVDRSTTAVIAGSPAVADRATVAYFGGLDGMIHAVCAGVTLAPCDSVAKLGTELWAFMPSTQLKNVPTNETRIDGSPKVSDVFADFDGTGKKTTRTVLTFQSGTNDSAATYALDITDPANPDVLWEYSTAGGGLATAIGVVNVPTEGLTSITFIQTSLGSGASAAGMELSAVRTSDGTPVWKVSQEYMPARQLVNNSPSAVSDVPVTGIPGGVGVFASVDGSLVDTLLVPTLWGAVWKLDPVNGESLIGQADCSSDPNWQTAGCTPLFQFRDDYHPIGASVSVYRDRDTSALHAVAVSGGFVDNEQPSASIWAPSSVNQFAVGFPLDVAVTDQDIKATTGFFVDLGAGNRAFSPAVILGNEIFITTDSADVFGLGTPTGLLTQANLSDVNALVAPAAPTSIVSGFASAGVSAASSSVYTGNGDLSLKTTVAYETGGPTVEQAVSLVARFLWLRSQ